MTIPALVTVLAVVLHCCWLLISRIAFETLWVYLEGHSVPPQPRCLSWIPFLGEIMMGAGLLVLAADHLPNIKYLTPWERWALKRRSSQ